MSHKQLLYRIILTAAAYFLVCLLLYALFGCNTVALELGAGYDRYIEQGTNPRNITSLRAELDGCFNTKGTCIGHFTHHSSYFSGWPFNHRSEDISNHIGVIYRYPIWQAK